MSLLPVLTIAGRNKLQAAQGSAEYVVLTTAALGSAARVPNGQETAMTAEVCRTPIGGHSLDDATGQLDLGVYFDGPGLGIVADHTITEVGFFDQDGVLIYYWSTAQGSLGSITAQSGYQLALSVTLSQADAAVIQIESDGSADAVVLQGRVEALEAGLKAAQLALPSAGAPAAAQSTADALGLGLAAADSALAAAQAQLPPNGALAAAAADLTTAASLLRATARRRAIAYAIAF